MGPPEKLKQMMQSLHCDLQALQSLCLITNPCGELPLRENP